MGVTPRRILSPPADLCNLPDNQDLAESNERVASDLPADREIDPDLERIIRDWHDLPPHIRQAILTLVGSVKGGQGDA